MEIKGTDFSVKPQVLSKTKKKEEPEIEDKVEIGKDSQEPEHKTGGVKAWIKKHLIGDTPDYKTECQMKKIVALGAAGGGVAGAVAGYALGYENAAHDTVSEEWKTHDIKNPTLTGWSHRDVEDGHYESHTYYTYESVSHTDSDGKTYYTYESVSHTYYTYEHDGYWHRNDPNINWSKVGDFKTPHLEHSTSIGPIGGAAIGLGAGIVGGGIIAAVCSHIFKLIRQH